MKVMPLSLPEAFYYISQCIILRPETSTNLSTLKKELPKSKSMHRSFDNHFINNQKETVVAVTPPKNFRSNSSKDRRWWKGRQTIAKTASNDL